MAVRTITTKLALTGEAEYRAKIKNLNADLALHKSELEKIQAEYKDSANSMAALGSKYSVMEAQLSTLNEKHAEQAEMLKKAEEAYDKYVKEVAALKGQQEALQNSSSATAEEEKKLAEQIAKAEENMQRAANSVTDYQKQLNRTERDQANLSAELAKTKKYWSEAQESADGCAHSIDQYGKEIKEAESESAEYRSKIKSLNEELALHKSQFEKVQAQYKNQANTTEALDAKYSAMEKHLATLNEKQKEQTGMLEKAQTAYQKYAQEVDSLEEKQKELQNSTEGSAEAEKQLKEQLEAAKKNMDEAAKSITSYQTELNVTERDQANLSAELDRTKGYLDEARSSADGCATSIDQYGKEVKQAAEETKELKDKGAASINALAQAIVAAGIAQKVEEVTAALYDCVDTFASFESQMSTVKAISGATGKEMAALTEKAKAMGASTSFTATEAGQALEYMAMAGWKTGDMLDGLEGIMNLAAASGESLASTSDIVTDALTAFGLKASDSAHFADVLAAASSSANTNVGMMGETFKYAAPVAGALGYSIEDTALAIGLMANAGIKGSSAGTALRSTLTNLSKPSNEVDAYMKKLGISLTDDYGKMLSLSELMGDLRDRFEDLTEAEQAEYAAGIAGKEAMSGLLAIVNASEEDYQKLTEAINDSNNAAYEMSRIRLDNYAGQITLLNSAMDGFKLAVGESLAQALGSLAEMGTGAFSWATEFVEEHPVLVQAIAGVASALALLTTGLVTYAVAQAAVTAMQGALGAAVTASLGPIAAVTAAVGALIAVIISSGDEMSELSEDTKKLTSSLKESKEAYEELTAAMEEESSGVSTSIKALEKLLDEEGKSASTKEQILRIVDKLNDALPDLGLSYDETTDSINMTTAALEQFAEKSADQGTHDAQMDRLVELREEYAALEDQITETQGKLDEAMETAQWNWEGRVMNDAAVAVERLRDDLTDLTAAQEACAAETAELEAATESYSQAQPELSNHTMMMVEKTKELRDQLAELEKSYQETYQAALESINSQMGLFEEMDGTADTSIDNLIGTLQGQVAYMETYAKNIQKAMEMGVDYGLVKKLSDGSKDSAKILDAIVQGGADDIKALNEEFAKVEDGKNAFAGTVEQMEKDFQRKMNQFKEDHNNAFQGMNITNDAYEVGQNNVQGLIDGTVSKKGALVKTYLEMGQISVGAYKKGSDQHSPSKKFYQAGTYDIQGLIQGAESEKGHLKSAYIYLAETGTLGVAEGLASSGDKVIKEADKLASEVYNQNKKWLDRQTKYQKLTLREQLDVWEAIQSQFVKESQQYADAEEKIFDLKARMQDEYLKKVEEVNKKITDLEKSYQDTLANRTKEIFNSYKLFDKAPDLEEVSGRELIGNLQSQINRMEDFYAGLRELSARGVGDALVEEIRAMGPSAMAQLDALLALSDLKLTEFADLYRRKQRLANYQAMEELQPLREETNRQIQESLNEMSAVYGQLAPAVGTAFTDAVAEGITNGSSTMTNAAAASAREAVAAAEQAMAGTVKTIGGVSYDLSVDYSKLMAAAKSYEEFAALAAQRNAKIIGENIDLVGKGFSDNSQLMAKWQENFARAEEEANQAIAAMAESISGDIQSVGSLVQDMQSCVEAESQLIQKQIDRSVSQLAEKMAAEFKAVRADIPQAVSNAVRDALSGMAVNLNQRKVGEIVDEWQRNNARGWGA